MFLSQSQLISEVSSHYAKQAIKQIYVLVLGLDIIGNPFGLLRDLSSGVQDFFYEPISVRALPSLPPPTSPKYTLGR